MDLSANGKYLASSSEDRTVLVWHSKDFSAKEHKCLRCNVEFDHGVFVRWSPDSKAFVVQKAVQVTLYFETSNSSIGITFLRISRKSTKWARRLTAVWETLVWL